MSRIHEALTRAEQERQKSSAGLMSVEDDVRVGQQPVVPPLEAVSAVQACSETPDNSYLPNRLEHCVKGNWNPDIRTMLFFKGHNDAPGQEEFRTLRSRLYQLGGVQPLKKVLVTSALPMEGKTMVAANLAQVLASQHGQRALLIDGDLRRPCLHKDLGTGPAPGLAEYLRGECDECAVLQRGPLDNLFFIPAGQSSNNAAELLASSRLQLLLSSLEPLFGWIIIDSAPALSVSDAGLLAGLCDGVLLVVQSGSTPFDLGKTLRREFPDRKLLGVVLNCAESRPAYRRA